MTIDVKKKTYKDAVAKPTQLDTVKKLNIEAPVKKKSYLESLMGMFYGQKKLHNADYVNPKNSRAANTNLKAYSFIEKAEMLNDFKDTINQVVDAYCKYSKSTWFSFFHYHGETGRVRANDFRAQMANITTYDEAVKATVTYLENEKNGNTNPHSFRTMLLHGLLGNPADLSLNAISNNFSAQLSGFKMSIPAETKSALSL